MSLRSNARIAGLLLLLYILTGITDMMLSRRSTQGADAREKLVSVARHVPEMRISTVLTMLQMFYAILLGVTFYSITRAADPDLALVGLLCRGAEGIVTSLAVAMKITIITLAPAVVEGGAGGGVATSVAAVLFKLRGSITPISAVFFAVGSLAFCVLLSRTTWIPRSLSVLGIVASAVLVVSLPLEAVRMIGGTPAQLMWLPMLVFEVAIAVLFLTRGWPAGEERRLDSGAIA